MTLKNIIKLCKERVNINFAGKSYGTIEHEFSCLYLFDTDSIFVYDKDYLKTEKNKVKEVLKKYGHYEVVSLYGFDDGLTITIKEK